MRGSATPKTGADGQEGGPLGSAGPRGKHPEEHIAGVATGPQGTIDKRRQDELYAIRKVRWSGPEYRALVDRFADAVRSFKIAVENENFAGIREAYASLVEITHQTNHLNEGLRHAINECMRETIEEFQR